MVVIYVGAAIWVIIANYDLIGFAFTEIIDEHLVQKVLLWPLFLVPRI
nr:hypothetical protein [Nonlabens sp. YIK11]